MQRIEEVGPGAPSRIPGFPGDLDLSAASAACGMPSDPPGEPARRLALARWLGNESNPLTPRVIANRLWHYHFGRGIVATPSDFGHNGVPPTHPELLDWLASELMSGGWRLKRLHRLMVTSYTYRQSSSVHSRGQAVDAGNQLLWRMPLRRLEAEAIRDAVLAASGKLDRRMGGPGFQLFRYRVVNVAIYESLEDYSPATWRRAVYQQAARNIHDDLMGSFDCPECAQRMPRRESTTTALQALSMLNGPFISQQAGYLADRIALDRSAAPMDQARAAFRQALARLPRPVEEKTAVELIRSHGLKDLCRALLNANEFLYY
jgi:hypothetical protein